MLSGLANAMRMIERAFRISLSLRAFTPIRFAINTHHHIDHSGGLRAAVAEGATIVTSILNKRIYPQYLRAPLTFAPDEMSKSKKAFVLKYVDDKLTMRDANRVIEIYNMHGNRHADDLLMIWLPKEKLLIEADALSPGPPNSPPPAQPDVFSVNLVDNIERLKLNVDRIIPIHLPTPDTRKVTMSELRLAAGKPAS